MRRAKARRACAYAKPCLAALVIMVMALGGCVGARELQNLPLVIGLSIDVKPGAPDRTLLTAQIVKPAAIERSGKGNDTGTISDKPFWNVQSDGETVFDCFRNITRMQHGRLFLNHSELLLFGEDMARKGITPGLDFFLRSPKAQPNTLLAVVRGEGAKALDTPAPVDKLPAANIHRLIKEQGETSEAREVTMLQFTNALISDTQAAMMPLITITVNNGDPTHTVEGMAVFKQDRMIGQLSPMQSRGVFWVTGDVKSGIVKIPMQGGFISIQIKSANSSFRPVMVDGKLRVKVSVRTAGVVVSQTTGVDTLSYEMIPVLEKLEEQVIVAEIQAALDSLREMNADVYGFGTAVHKGRVMDWAQAIEQWPVIFPQLPVDLEILCNIRSEGLIVRPVEPRR